ncbi:MAG: hypothetical protein JWP81_3448 [Ferruginibacter sp.]|nr:hypothetical protein [Ferruginibacter sp.]
MVNRQWASNAVDLIFYLVTNICFSIKHPCVTHLYIFSNKEQGAADPSTTDIE